LRIVGDKQRISLPTRVNSCGLVFYSHLAAPLIIMLAAGESSTTAAAQVPI
jgi:hypothetical protein